MKPLFLSFSLVLCWLLAITPGPFFFSHEGRADTTLVRTLVTPNFHLLIQRAEDGNDIYTVITTTNGKGLKIDQKALVETRWRLDSGCHRHQESGEYLLRSNYRFTFTLKTTDLWCGFDREEDEGEQQYRDRLLLEEDPYSIPGREFYKVTVQHYLIDDVGKIRQEGGYENVLTDRWTAMNRFDLLPRERVALLRHTIFAQKGYAFKSQELKDYFSAKSWYTPKYDNIVRLLSASDKKLIAYLEKLENR
jgi:hypothetical protein